MRLIRGPDLASLHRQVVPYIKRNCYKNQSGLPMKFAGENGYDNIVYSVKALKRLETEESIKQKVQ